MEETGGAAAKAVGKDAEAQARLGFVYCLFLGVFLLLSYTVAFGKFRCSEEARQRGPQECQAERLRLFHDHTRSVLQLTYVTALLILPAMGCAVDYLGRRKSILYGLALMLLSCLAALLAQILTHSSYAWILIYVGIVLLVMGDTVAYALFASVREVQLRSEGEVDVSRDGRAFSLLYLIFFCSYLLALVLGIVLEVIELSTGSSAWAASAMVLCLGICLHRCCTVSFKESKEPVEVWSCVDAHPFAPYFNSISTQSYKWFALASALRYFAQTAAGMLLLTICRDLPQTEIVALCVGPALTALLGLAVSFCAIPRVGEAKFVSFGFKCMNSGYLCLCFAPHSTIFLHTGAHLIALGLCVAPVARQLLVRSVDFAHVGKSMAYVDTVSQAALAPALFLAQALETQQCLLLACGASVLSTFSILKAITHTAKRCK